MQRLEQFLKLLKINPAGHSLAIDIGVNALKSAMDETEESVAAEAEVDPIPFDSSESSSEF